MSEDLHDIFLARIEAAQRFTDEMIRALANVPADDRLFVLATVTAALIKEVPSDQGERDAAFEGFLNMMWSQLNDDELPKIQ